MKKVEAIIKPFKLDEVKDALSEVGIQGMMRESCKFYLGRRPGAALCQNNIQYLACNYSILSKCFVKIANAK